jgi:hypothetical protein
MAITDGMINDHFVRAKAHVYNVCQAGADITLIKPATKDRMGGILTETTLELKSFPVRFSPFDRETAGKISWAENVNVIFYVAMKELDLASLTIKDVKHYTHIKHDSKNYELAYIDNYSGFAENFLYIIIGGKL